MKRIYFEHCRCKKLINIGLISLIFHFPFQQFSPEDIISSSSEEMSIAENIIYLHDIATARRTSNTGGGHLFNPCRIVSTFTFEQFKKPGDFSIDISNPAIFTFSAQRYQYPLRI